MPKEGVSSGGRAAIIDEPQVRCPFCRGLMPGWMSRYPGKTCTLCARPLFLLPFISSRHYRSVLSAIDVVKIIMLPVMAGATISFAMGRLEADSYACIVAGALLTWGMIDVWDGTAGLRTGLDKVRKRICRGAVARKMSLAKTIFGSASMVRGAIGLLMVR